MFLTFNILFLEDEGLIISCFRKNLIQGNMDSVKWLFKTWSLFGVTEIGGTANLESSRKIMVDPVDTVKDIIMNADPLIPTLKWFQKQYNCSFKTIFEQFKYSLYKDQTKILKHIFNVLELKDIKWFVENFNVREVNIFQSHEKKGYFIPLVEACNKESLKLAKWAISHFKINKKDILEWLGAYSSSKNILIYLKNKYNIIKEDIKINKILMNLLTKADFHQDYLIIFIDVFNINRKELMEAIDLNYKNKIYPSEGLKYLLFFKYGILAPQ